MPPQRNPAADATFDDFGAVDDQSDEGVASNPEALKPYTSSPVFAFLDVGKSQHSHGPPPRVL